MTRLAALAVVAAACTQAPPMHDVAPTQPPAPVQPAAQPHALAPASPPALDAGTPPAPVPLATTGSLSAIADVPAWDAAAAAGHLVVVDDNFLTASAVDAATGAAAWRVTIESTAVGWHTLHPNGAQIIEWAGDTMHVLDAATGSERAARHGVFNGHGPGERRGCWLAVSAGVCAEACECRFQLFDCATGANVGRHYDKPYMEFFPINAPPSSGCYAGDGAIIGRAKDLAIISSEDTQTPSTRPRPGPLGDGAVITAAVDLRTGTEAWLDARSTASAPSSGTSPDGATCWLADGGTAELRVVDCASGALLWHVPAPPSHDARRMTGFVGGDSIYELLDRRASRRDARSGKVRWSVELPPHTIAWPRGLDVAIPYNDDDVATIAILDPATGKTLASVAREPDSGLVPDHAGGIVITGKAFVYLAPDGGVHRAPLVDASVEIGEHLIAASTPNEVVILARDDLRELGRVHGPWEKVLVEGALGADRFAMFAYDGKVIGRATLFRVTR